MKKRKLLITDKDIQEFLKQAELLSECSYLKSSGKSKVDINYKEGQGIKFSANMLLREDIEVILLRIRPFIEYNERLHVGRVISYLLKTYGKSEFLLALQFEFQPKSELQYPAITVNNKEYRMRDLLILYMYGKYIHLDRNKQEVYSAFEQVFGPLAEYFALSQVDKYVGVVLSVAGYIRKYKLLDNEHRSNTDA